ncbi:MAG: hypothetical protein P4L46_08935 [Fimbriimonas sp.]|nr:hypothetical protein [Fimbriimonas sp.]
MTFLSLAFAFALQAPTAGQPDVNETTFQTVFSQLASNETLFLQLNGAVNYGSKITPIISTLAWSTSTSGAKPIAQLELQEFTNGVMMKRIVGDGDTLWSYDMVAHTYSATSYGGSGSTRPTDYQQDLLSDLNWATTGQTAYLAKLLRQVYSTTGTFISWMPGVRSQNLPQNVPVNDPINPYQSYSPTANDWFYLYNGSPKRSIVFEIVPQAQSSGLPPIDTLQNIFFSQVDQLGASVRFTHWQVTPYPGVTFSTEIFQPFSGSQIQGWHPVVGPKPVSN